jgi:hypothetical protein
MHEADEREDSHDPLMNAQRESSAVNELWLTSKRPLAAIQRLGFTIVCGLIAVGGALFPQIGVGSIRDHQTGTEIITAVAGCGFLVLGIAGLWRVFHDVFLRK